MTQTENQATPQYVVQFEDGSFNYSSGQKNGFTVPYLEATHYSEESVLSVVADLFGIKAIMFSGTEDTGRLPESKISVAEELTMAVVGSVPPTKASVTLEGQLKKMQKTQEK